MGVKSEGGGVLFQDQGDLSIVTSGYCTTDDIKSTGNMLRQYFTPQNAAAAGHTPSSSEFETSMYLWHPAKPHGDDDDDGEIDVEELELSSPHSGSGLRSPSSVLNEVDTSPFALLLRAVKDSSLFKSAPGAPIVDYSVEVKNLRQRQTLFHISRHFFVSNERRAKLFGMNSGHDLVASIGEFASGISNSLYGLVEACGRAASKRLSERRARRSKAGGSSSDLIESVEKASAAWLEAHTAALSRSRAGLDDSRSAAPLTSLVSTSLRLLYIMSGGFASSLADDRRLVTTADGRFACSDDDGALQAALVVDSLNHVVSLSKLAGFDGYSGMHTIEAAEEWLCALRQIFVACGALPPQLSTRLRPQHTVLEWIQLLPMFAFTESSKQGLMYLFSIIAGQQRLVLQPIMRGNVLASLAAALQKDSTCRDLFRYSMNAESTRFIPPASHKAFPIFATEGIGLESGEGHGPRKELFDSVSIDLTASRAPPVDLTSSVSVTVLSSLKELSSTRIARGQAVSGIGAVCLLAWRQTKLVKKFESGDSLTVNMVLRSTSSSFIARGGVGAGGLAGDEKHITECWTVAKEIEAVSASETILLLTSTTRLPQGYRLQSIHASQKREPLVVHDEGEENAWLNASLGEDVTTLSQCWAAGWALANAIPNGLMLSAPLPPLLFHLLRLFDTSTMRFPPDVRSSLIAEDRLDLLSVSLLKPSLVENAKQIVELSQRDFEELVMAEGMDAKKISRQQLINETVVKGSVMCCGGSPDLTLSLLSAFCRGFFSSSASSCAALLFSGSAKQLRRFFCAPADDGKEDFSFQEHFRLVEDAEFTQFPHSRIFRSLFFRSLEEHEPLMKRQVLKFITGRVLLPHQPKSEHIKVEFPFSPMTAREFDLALARLPSSHSCDNVLEMPNYLECLLFGSKSPFYAAAKKPVTSVILDDAKEKAWQLLDERERSDLAEKTISIMRSKLVAAVEMSGTYELDDGAIRADVREAFDKQFASAGPALPAFSRDDSSTIPGSLPKLASTLERSTSPPRTSPIRDRSPSFFRRQGTAQSPPATHRVSVSPGQKDIRRSSAAGGAMKTTVRDFSDDDSDEDDVRPIGGFTSPSKTTGTGKGAVVLGHHNRSGGGGPREQLAEATPSRNATKSSTGGISAQRLSVFSKQNDDDDDDEVLQEPAGSGAGAGVQNSYRGTTSGGPSDHVVNVQPSSTSPQTRPVNQSTTPKPTTRRAADLDDLESELFGHK